MKKETLSDGSVLFCMSLYTSFCDVTTRYISIFQPYKHRFKGTNFRTRWSVRINIHVISSLYFLMHAIADSLTPQWLQTAVLVIPLHISTYVTLPRHNWNMRPKLNAGNWENHIEEHYRRGNIQPIAYYSARLCKHDRESAMNLTAMHERYHNNSNANHVYEFTVHQKQ